MSNFAPQYRRDMEPLERAQCNATKMIRAWNFCEERQRELGLLCLEKRKFRGDPINVCKPEGRV